MITRSGRPSVPAALLLALLALLLPGCDDNAVLEPDGLVEPLVGQWDAVELVLSPPEGSPVNLLASGATLFLDIQPSGIYTAYLKLDGAVATEIGRLDVGATMIVMEAEYPAPGTSRGTYEVVGDRLTIEGQTETLLGGPGTTTVADVRMVFLRR